MNVQELLAALEGVEPYAPVEIEIECLDGAVRRSVDVKAARWVRGPTGAEVFVMIEGDEPPKRKIRDAPQA